MECTKEDIEHTKDNGGQEPYIGMKFESKEKAYLFYTCYAKIIGFGVSIKSSCHSKTNK